MVRPAEPGDLRHLPALEVAAGAQFRAVGMDAVADDEPPPEAEYAAALDVGLLWVATETARSDGPPVGYAWAVVAWAAATGAGSLTLSTFRDVPWNGPWYGRRGFSVVPLVALDERLEAVRHHEEERGLDTGARVIMRRALDPT